MIRELVAKGMSLRMAERAFKAIFDVMKRALRRGEEVELPFGTLIVKSSPPRRQRLQQIQRIDGPKQIILRVINRHRRKVVFRQNKNFKFL